MSRRAFTMLEIVVVLVVLGILGTLAVAGTRTFIERTNDTQAEATLDRVKTAEQSFANSFGSYTNHPDDLLDLGRDIDLVVSPAVSTDATTASLAVGENGTLGVAVHTSNGTCKLLAVAPLGAGFAVPGSGQLDPAGQRSEAPEGAPCNGAEAIPAGEGLTAETPKR